MDLGPPLRRDQRGAVEALRNFKSGRVLEHDGKHHKLGTRINVYLVALSSRRVFSLPLQTQQDLLKPGNIGSIGSCSGDSFALRIL